MSAQQAGALLANAALRFGARATGLQALLPIVSTASQPALSWPTSQAASWVQTRVYASSSAEIQYLQLQAALDRKDHMSLYHARPSPISPELENSTLWRYARKMLLYDSNNNKLILGGQCLYDAIKEQVDDGELQRAFDMDPKIFYSTYTLLAIHVWLVIHRLGGLTDSDARFFKQRFYNHFQADVETRIFAAGVQMGVTKWLKKLESVFYSSGLSMDRVLRREGDETIEKVVLREFFGGDLSKRQQANLIAKYIMRELQCLELTEDRHIMQGHIQFSQRPFMSRSPPVSTSGNSVHD